MNSGRPALLGVRVTTARVAGKALGVMMVEVRFRGDVMTREDIDTGNGQSGTRATMGRPTYSDSDPSGRRGRHRRDGYSRCPWRQQDGSPQTRGRGWRELEGQAASGGWQIMYRMYRYVSYVYRYVSYVSYVCVPSWEKI